MNDKKEKDFTVAETKSSQLPIDEFKPNIKRVKPDVTKFFAYESQRAHSH